MEKKQSFYALGILVMGMVLLTVIYQPSTNEDLCNEFGVLYIKPSQEGIVKDLLPTFKGIIIVPETGRIYGTTEYLECDNYNPWDYIGVDYGFD